VLAPTKEQTKKALGADRQHVCLGNHCSCNAGRAAAKRAESIASEKTF
jgi:hypothetical protein